MSRFFANALLLTLAGTNSAVATVIYSDNFSGPTLNPAWQVLSGQGTYAMVGDLRYSNQGPQSSPGGWATTSMSLSLPFTGTNWQADVTATYSLQWGSSGNYTGPSVPSPGNSSGAQAPQVIMSFDPITEGNRTGLSGPGNYADFYRGVDAFYGSNVMEAFYGATTVPGLINPADLMINNNVAGGTYFYRFGRNGGTLTMLYSYDGLNYFTALTTALSNPLSNFNQLLLSATTFSSAGSFTDFTNVTITDTTIPEPGAFTLIASALLVLPLLRRVARGRATD